MKYIENLQIKKMKLLDEIKKNLYKKNILPVLTIISLLSTYQANCQSNPHVTNIGSEGTETTCDLIFIDYNNDGNIDEIKITKDEKNNQVALYLKKGDEQGNLTNFPKPISRHWPKASLLINWNSQKYIKAIVNDFDNNGIQDVKFITRDDEGLNQYNFYGDGKGKFTNNSDEKYWLKPVPNN